MVSIIIPVYNVRDYVVKCLESVAAQTYTGAIECLIIDDCGQDDSIQLVEDYVTSYNGHIEFRIIHHDHNKGLSAARNTGIRESKGEWIYFLDSDDWITPDCIQLMMNQVKIHLDVDMVQGHIYTDEDKDMNRWLHHCVDTTEIRGYSNDTRKVQHYLQSLTHMPMVQNRLIARFWLVKNRLFFFEGILHEDQHWTMKAGRCIDHIAIISEETYYYRINKNGITSSFGERNFNSMCMVCDDLASHLCLRNLCDEISYICLLLNSASVKYNQDALDYTRYCHSHLFRKMYNMYLKNGSFSNFSKLKAIKYKLLLVAVFIYFRVITCLNYLL